MFTKSVKIILAAAILATTSVATVTTTAQASEYMQPRHHMHGVGNAAAMGAAGFLIGSFIGATLHRPDGSSVTSRYPRVGPRNVHIYEETDRFGRVIKRKTIRKVKKIRKVRKPRPVFASAYDPSTNIRTTSFRDAKGRHVIIRTHGRALPPQVR